MIGLGPKGIPPALLDAKGDLIGASAADTAARVAAPSDGQLLKGRASASVGVVWEAPHVFDVRDYGASLNAAAVQAAINAAQAAGGGIVQLPSGLIDMQGTPLTFPSDFSIVLQGTGQGTGQEAGTYMVWGLSLGTGVYAIDTGISATPYHIIRDVTLEGAGAVVNELEPLATVGYGIKWAPRMLLDNVHVSRFRAGVVVWGDHQRMQNCTIDSNYYNVYWPTGMPTTGDQSFLNCILAGTSHSSVATSGGDANAQIGARFYGCHFGFGPYCFFGEPKGSPYSMIADSALYSCSFETVGKGLIYAPGEGNIDGLTMAQTNAGTPLTDTTQDAAINVRDMFNVHSIGQSSWPLGDQAFIKGGAISQVTWEDAGELVADCRSTGVPVFLVTADLSNVCVENNEVKWIARLPSAAVVQDDLLEASGAEFKNVAPISTGKPVGVAGHTQAATGSGQSVLVQIAGKTPIKAHAAGNPAAGAYVKPSTSVSGAVMDAASAVDGDVIGQSENAAAGGKVTTRLRGLA